MSLITLGLKPSVAFYTSAPMPCSSRQWRRSSRLTVPAATADDESSTPPSPDIDQLAAFLTQKAAEMRASMDEQVGTLDGV